MRCPNCGKTNTKCKNVYQMVIHTIRDRWCPDCGYRFKTWELPLPKYPREQ